MTDRLGIHLGLLVGALLGFMVVTETAAPAQEVWRLAGTFNNWNASDDTWRMAELPNGQWFMRRDFQAGTYEFKFVKNGDWNAGHFGASTARGETGSHGGNLEQPGMDLSLIVAADGPIGIILDVQKKRWRIGAPDLDQPVVIARVQGVPRVGVPLTIDLTASFVPPGMVVDEMRIAFDDREAVTIGSLEDGGWLTPRITPKKPGLITARIKIKAGAWSREETIRFEVLARVFAFNPSMVPESVDLVPIGNDRWAAVFKVRSASVQTFKVRDTGRHRALTAHAHPKSAGEMFALIYDVPTGKAFTIPGWFRIEETSGVPRLIDETPVEINGLRHDPRRPDHFISISRGLGLVDIVLWADERWDEGTLTLRLATDEGDILVPMIRSSVNDVGYRRWIARLQDDSDHGWISYSIAGTRDSFDPDATAVFVDLGPFNALTDPLFETPDWAKKAVWYQIFPERFRNGEPSNDPHGDGVQALPWNSKWHALHEGEFEAWQARVRRGGGNPDRWDREKISEPGGRFYNVVWDRRYGGDLEGVIEKLGYLDALGVTAIYLNPVFEGISMHKYDTSDYRHVDDNFGGPGPVPEAWTSNPDEDDTEISTWEWTPADQVFLKLIEEAHGYGLKVVIDGVFNHVGKYHPAFQDVVAHGDASPYADWFTVEFDQGGNLKSWVAWDGPSGWLPKLKQRPDRSLVAPVRDHIFAITQRWMDPNGDGDPSDGIDGWRLDVPLDVGDPFWDEWYDHVKGINPKAYIVAEIWSDHESLNHLRGNHFDAQMHYPFASAVIDWLVMRPGMTADDLARELDAAYGNDAPQTQLVQQNLYESHDTDRLVSSLFNATPVRKFDAGNRPQQGEPYDESRPDERAYALSRLALVLQATYAGAPMVYYGQEGGMFGADDPSCRKPMPWPDTGPMENEADAPDESLREFYQHWLRRRRGSETLQLGLVQHVATSHPDVFAFERRLNDECILIVVNRGEQPFALSRICDDPKVAGRMVPPLGAVAVTVVP